METIDNISPEQTAAFSALYQQALGLISNAHRKYFYQWKDEIVYLLNTQEEIAAYDQEHHCLWYVTKSPSAGQLSDCRYDVLAQNKTDWLELLGHGHYDNVFRRD